MPQIRFEMLRPVAFAALAVAFFAAAPHKSVVADSLPSGEVQLGQTVIEPGYDALTGKLTYVLTPIKPPVHPTTHNVAPFYLIVYPNAVAGAVGTMNCQHQPADNCADHGPFFAGFAETMKPTVYASGVWGHDHIFAAPPSPPAAGDFNIDWVPTAVLFTDLAFASNHITTLSQLNAAYLAGQVTITPLPADTFHCSIVPAATFNRGTPLPTAPPLP